MNGNESLASETFGEAFNGNVPPSFIRFNNKKMDEKRLTSLKAVIAVINENNNRNAPPRVVIQGSRINLNINDAALLQLVMTTLQDTTQQIEQSAKTYTRNSFRTKVWAPALEQASLAPKEAKAKTTVQTVIEPAKPDTYSSETIDTLIYQGNSIPVNPLRDAIVRSKSLTKFNEFMKAEFDTEVHGPSAAVDNYIRLILPIYSNDEQKTAQVRERVLSYLGLLATKLKADRNPINIQFAKLVFSEFSKPRKVTVTPAYKMAATPTTISVRIDHVNDISLKDFANYIADKRTLSLKPFGADQNLGIAIRLGGQGKEHHFLVDVPFVDGVIDEAALHSARFLLGRLRQEWVKGSAINTDKVRDFLAQEVPALIKKSNIRPGDKLKPIFVEIAREDGQAIHLPRPTARPVKDAPLPILVETSKRPGMFDNSNLKITLPDFNEDGLSLKHEVLMPTPNQSIVMQEAEAKDVIMVDGPAGTGKTMWICFIALKGFVEGKYAKISLTAPVVEADENLGFMKGDKDQKMNHHVNQILETMDELLGKGDAMLGKTKREEMMELGAIEIAPHAFNRGRTYKNTFYILDECQNATWRQLTTAIHRIGNGSTFVFMGDDKQNDRTRQRSAYAYFVDRYKDPAYANFIGHVSMGKEDIRRHPLLRLIADRGDEETPPELVTEKSPSRHAIRREIANGHDISHTNGHLPAPSLS